MKTRFEGMLLAGVVSVWATSGQAAEPKICSAQAISLSESFAGIKYESDGKMEDRTTQTEMIFLAKTAGKLGHGHGDVGELRLTFGHFRGTEQFAKCEQFAELKGKYRVTIPFDYAQLPLILRMYQEVVDNWENKTALVCRYGDNRGDTTVGAIVATCRKEAVK